MQNGIAISATEVCLAESMTLRDDLRQFDTDSQSKETP